MVMSDKLKEQMGDWWRLMLPFVESEDMNKLFSYIKERSKVSRICPASVDLWNAFKLCPPESVRVIICGISPYHTWTEKAPKGIPVADGLALSCSKTWKSKGLQPSLDQLYNCLELEYNDGMMNPLAERNPSLEEWAAQGVLLYNIALTVEEEKPLSHMEAWSKFNQFFFEEIVNKVMRGVCVVFLGQQAWKSEQYLAPMLHYSFKLPHPASSAYKGDHWSDAGVWKQMDKIMMDNNGNTILWMPNLPS